MMKSTLHLMILSISALSAACSATAESDTGEVDRGSRTSQRRALPTGDDLSSSLRARAEQHVVDAFKSGVASRWRDATLGRVRPIHRPDLDGVAYYEVTVLVQGAPAGFVVLATGDHDAPIVHWNDSGIAPTERLAAAAIRAPSRFYRLGASYAAEDEQGALVADSAGAMPSAAPGAREAFARDWPAIRARYAEDHAEEHAALAKEAEPLWEELRERGTLAAPGVTPQAMMTYTPPRTCILDDAYSTPLYNQVPPYTGPNTDWYYSGCAATAWAIALGWADRRAAAGDPRWAPYWGLYRAGGQSYVSAPDAVAPDTFDAGAQQLAVTLSDILGTVGIPVASGPAEGSTEWWKMSRFHDYLGRVAIYGDALLTPTFDWGGGAFDSLRDRAVSHICSDRAPAVIGIYWGGGMHYAVASAVYGNSMFLNLGWSGEDNGWYWPNVFFAGSILPNRKPVYPTGMIKNPQGQCLTVQNASSDNGASVISWECGWGWNQAWTFGTDGTIYEANGKCMDVDHAQTYNGVRVQQWDCNGTPAQKWRLERFKLRGSSDLCADGYAGAGTAAVIDHCYGDAAQQWTFRPDGDLQLASGLCLEATGTGNGASVIVNYCNGSAQQRWVPAQGGAVKGAGGRCLNVRGSAASAYSPLELWDCSGWPSQRWIMSGAVRGLADKCLDVAYNASYNGTQATLWDCYGGINQEWDFIY